MTLTPHQYEVLRYLNGCGHANRSTLRRIFGQPPTNTLKSLERIGYVRAERIKIYGGFVRDDTRWEITDRGRRAL